MIRRINNKAIYRRPASSLNEAVQRTIDQKLWASVSSGISRNYKADMGASAKPIGTRDQLLQRYIAAMVILKQACPMSLDELENSPAFPQWGKKLVEMGVSIEEVQKLWNENCGKLPQVKIGGAAAAAPASTEAPAAANVDDMDDDEDDLGFALGMSEEEYQADQAAKKAAAAADRQAAQARQTSAATSSILIEPEEDTFEPEREVKHSKVDADDDGFRRLNITGGTKARIISSDDLLDPGRRRPNLKQKVRNLGKFTTDVNTLKRALHKGLIAGRNFPELNGCQNPNDSMKPLNVRQLEAEGIQDCENLDDFKVLMNETGVCFAMRVFSGGDPEEVKGDVVWCDAPTETSYYIACGDGKVGIYYKDKQGIFTCAYIDTLENFGFSN